MAKPAPSQVYTTLKLAFPFETVEGTTISELSIRRIKVGDMRQVSKQYNNQGDVEVALFALATGLIFEDMDAMDYYDYSTLQGIYKEMTEGKSLPPKS